MIEAHKHTGLDSPKVNVKSLEGPVVWTDDYALSAQKLGSVLQRGIYTLASNKTFVTFPHFYTSAGNISVTVTPNSSTVDWVESIAAVQGIYISGFTVSGYGGTDSGYWIALGYK